MTYGVCLSIEGRTVTRGHGLLEGFLARQRSRQADRLIPDSARTGRVLDIGFGTYPLFLSGTRFAERFGLDRTVADTGWGRGLHLIAHDVALNRHLPFGDEFFDVVTMLAVFEHLDRRVLLDLVREIRRVLVPRGSFVMTTPAGWTAGILKLMSRLTLVSRDEVDEHEAQHSRQQIVELLAQGGFDSKHIETGTFELGMNLWARARRPV